MEAKVGSNASFIWRSILSARDTLQARSLWKLGDGKSIKIWEDQWLPCKLGKNPLGPDVQRVCEILDEDQKWWNESVIDEAFDAKTASAIKQMPLGNINTPDVL